MLDFFRKYQRFFFIIITVVIIISFSFFGTYNTLSVDSMREQTAFTTIDNSVVKRHELEEMTFFLGTDSMDKSMLGGTWGPNFLNDGVIKHDILETGLGEILVSQYPDLVKSDLEKRFEKEKYVGLYTHPQAKFIGVESAWNYFAPEMKASYQRLKNASNPVSPEAFKDRVFLFLGQQQLTPSVLRQILRYQEKQFQWIQPDANLDRQDLFVFGYHNAEDWFGPRFMRLACEFIINSAIVAEQKGYRVSKEEALADLMQNAALSFQQNQRNPYLGVANSTEYFNEQLRLLNIDQTKAVKIWRQVMLFRRLFDDVGNAIVIDPLAYEKFNDYAGATIFGEAYRLPKDLHLGSERALQKFEFYLNAVSKRSKEASQLLDLPTEFFTASEVSKKYPELLQKRYLIEFSEAKKSALQSKVALKETWDWEVESANWEKLKKQFPELGVKKGDSKEERFAALDQLDTKTRSKVDQYARNEIIQSHPEWIDNSLVLAPITISTVGLRSKGGHFPFKGVSNREELIKLLDQTTLAGEGGENDAAKKLLRFSGDQETFYRIKVIDRDKDSVVLTFAEANQDDMLDKLLDRELEKYYQLIQSTSPDQFQKEDKSWKPFAEVRDLVAKRYIEKIEKAIQKDYIAAIAPEKAPPVFLGDFTASLRFYKPFREYKNAIQKNPADSALLFTAVSNEEESHKLEPRLSLESQWKPLKEEYHAEKKQQGGSTNQNDIFTLSVNDWSKVYTPASGDIFFVHVEKKENANHEAIADKVTQIQQMLAADAQRHYGRKLVGELKEKNALSLDYLNVSEEPSMEPDANQASSG